LGYGEQLVSSPDAQALLQCIDDLAQLLDWVHIHDPCNGTDHQDAVKHAVCSATSVSFLGYQLVGAETGKSGVGGTVPTVGRIKIARKAGNFAVPANVDVYRRTIDSAETSAINVLLATTPGGR